MTHEREVRRVILVAAAVAWLSDVFGETQVIMKVIGIGSHKNFTSAQEIEVPNVENEVYDVTTNGRVKHSLKTVTKPPYMRDDNVAAHMVWRKTTAPI